MGHFDHKESRSSGGPKQVGSPLLTSTDHPSVVLVPELPELSQHVQYYIEPALTISCDEISIKLMQ